MRGAAESGSLACARARRVDGFTLLELMIVMVLIALLLGLGLGVFASLDVGDRAAVGNVQNVVRSAHNWAVARVAPARVRIDPALRTLRADGLQIVGTWHFESLPPEGAFGLPAASFGGHLVDDGFQGRALSFAGEGGRAHVDFDVERDSSWSISEGFALRCAVRRAGARGGSLLDLGGSAGADTTDDGAVKAWFEAQRRDDDTQSSRGGRVWLSTQPGLLAPDRWAQIEVRYDRHALEILVDGQLAAQVTESASVARLKGPLVLSPSVQSFPGDIDSLVVAAVVKGDESELPRGVEFGSGTPAEIVFQPGGGLDRAFHREAVRIALDFEDGRRETVLVNLFGTVE